MAMRILQLGLLTVLLLFNRQTSAAAPYSNTVVHESRADIVLETWTKDARFEDSEPVLARIALTQRNLDVGHRLLMEMSNPESPTYGQHMSRDEVFELFAPSNETITSVTRWLTSSGVHVSRIALSPNKQWIQFTSVVSELERVLNATYHLWHQPSTGTTSIAAEAYGICDLENFRRRRFADAGIRYSIPEELVEHIDYILPGTHLYPKKSSPRRTFDRRQYPASDPEPAADDDCSMNVTPACLRAMYNITEGTLAHKGNQIGFYEFVSNYYQPAFDNFTKKYYPRIPQGFAPTVFTIDGLPTAPIVRTETEAALDVDVAMPIVYPQGFVIFEVSDDMAPTTYIRAEWDTWLDAVDGSFCNYTADGITGDDPSVDPTYPDSQWPKQLQCGVYQPTNVMSVSYGSGEPAFPAAYLDRQCNEYMKLGMQGITVVCSSGDDGVTHGFEEGGPVCLGKNQTIFIPEFPASCPYVTAVGGTQYVRGANVTDHKLEHAWSSSGGGFSNIFATAEYQKDAVQSFLTQHPPAHKSYTAFNDTGIGKDGGVFNRAGRAIPDVASVAVYVDIVVDTDLEQSGGTSAAAPLWAAIFTRINEERLARGKSTVGFVNPALYANPRMMHDITAGGPTTGCDSGTSIVGFNATEGWDPATGLGSPAYPALLEYFLGLQ